ncbi:MAG: hypothetical protein CEO12_45 [Parcubacteria group bacterium Gr01-1014_46]|nr:MAG: hypothetical protein CEO12_45 [Parcubacteria group bacterium Gr01-1014_46]
MNYKALHLDEGETVVLEVRKHWIVFAGIAFGLLTIAFLPIIIFSLLEIFLPSLVNFDFPGNGSALFVFLHTLWILGLWALFFVDWTKYYLDVWYVTEKRIIAIDQRFIFSREVSNLRFDKIQDITVDVHGFIPTMLNFGSIRVQTASEDSKEFYIKNIRHPENIRKVIFGRQNKINDAVR